MKACAHHRIPLTAWSVMFIAWTLLTIGCAPEKPDRLTEEKLRYLEERIIILTNELARAESRRQTAEDRLLQRERSLQQEKNALMEKERMLSASRQEIERISDAWKRSESERQTALTLMEDATNQLFQVSATVGKTNQDDAAIQMQLREALARAASREEQLQASDAYVRKLERVTQAMMIQSAAQAESPEAQRAALLTRRLTPAAGRAIPRSVFTGVIQGMTTTELTQYIGAPDTITEDTTPIFYVYNRPLTYISDPTNPDSSVRIAIQDGIVKHVLFGN